jgi:hypothetical protein
LLADEAFFFAAVTVLRTRRARGALMRPAFDKSSMQSFPGENTRL